MSYFSGHVHCPVIPVMICRKFMIRFCQYFQTCLKLLRNDMMIRFCQHVQTCLKLIYITSQALELATSLAVHTFNDQRISREALLSIDHTINMTWHGDQETTFIKASFKAQRNPASPSSTLTRINERKCNHQVKIFKLFSFVLVSKNLLGPLI